MKLSVITTLAILGATTAFAESHAEAPLGNAEAGEAAFKRQCVACHVVVDDEGNKLAGRNARTGPNLYGLAGRAAGSVEGYRYGKSTIKAGEEFGLIWDAATFTPYVMDPTGYLRTLMDDSKARSKMGFKVRKEEDAHDIFAYLTSLAPPVAE